jgi:hypothetical protein
VKIILEQGATGQSVFVFIQNSAVANGSGLTGLAYNTSGLTCYYVRTGDTSDTAVTLATATLGTWVSGGFLEVDSTNMPGLYWLCLPNACIASGVTTILYLQGAANMAPLVMEIQQTQWSFANGVVQVGSYATGMSPSAQVLKNPTDPILTNSAGDVSLIPNDESVLADLYDMISGSGDSATYTVNALKNAPSGALTVTGGQAIDLRA